ncbi:hypothetical protein GUITHDRAFT_68506 [Guillardia theta CCMP2712]|uniref:GS catalytic domain-containing protein n=1 Tax=Guillardia theta (strain CCMP2712) TaxID=905079 RepID=L1JK61_GUITC|nr:hypothetical protein GUITHDRAFT_68506 [Guillardia theta CCMP2712]EKX48707.1 hypothetical protein GUITHDRAFT_68506 [Guillardia theta CCMP2712]|eukprot:XP_005835687.1 hypothetical protein GUITHDRAFT_68506 [Guillardia theta CCMP2712]
MEDYGQKVFVGAVADKYLGKYGESSALLKDHSWVKDQAKAEKVAAALLDWGRDSNATVFTHWFQPLGANGVRHGQTGQVHNYMFTFGADGKPCFKFKAGELLRGETDGSSYPNGGLRATHTAGAYTVLDPTSPIFILDDTIYAPTIFISYHGQSLDEKIPLLRSEQAMSAQCVRLLKLMGHTTAGVQSNIGLEQEFFLIPRDSYDRRPDLQQCGRTILGKMPPRGQEMCDHYMAPLNQHALNCLREIQHEAFKLGIPLKTRHREVAPNQYEMAPYFGHVTSQIDQNLLVMQLCEEIAAKYELAALFQEKPFSGVNGSGKHNNWSLGTKEGLNLMNAGQVAEVTGNLDIFPVLIAAVVTAVDKHSDLMRAAIADPGNDFRLGAMEAPPSIISTYLGDSLTEYLEGFKGGKRGEYKPKPRTVDTGCDLFGTLEVPTEDRNRTSPFPYGGHRFEFRAVGSAQNVSMVNTVLNTICADAFKEFADKIEGGMKADDVAAEALKEHWKIIFNGNGYSEEWKAEAGKRGLCRIDSGVEAMEQLGAEKNLEMFAKLGVMSKEELLARRDIALQHYTGLVEIEAGCMIDMITQNIVPSVKETGISTAQMEAECAKVKAKYEELEHEEDPLKKAKIARELRLDVMANARKVVDEVESICPAKSWPFATYRDLLFLDQNQGHNATPFKCV